MFLGNVNALFGPGLRYGKSMTSLRLKAFEKEEIKAGHAALFTVKNNNILRIKNNGAAY